MMRGAGTPSLSVKLESRTTRLLSSGKSSAMIPHSNDRPKVRLVLRCRLGPQASANGLPPYAARMPSGPPLGMTCHFAPRTKPLLMSVS